jgi:hypothetical protein
LTVAFTNRRFPLATIICLLSLFCVPHSASAQGDPKADNPKTENALLDQVESEFSGRIRTRARVSWPEDGSFFELVDTDTNGDASAELRLMEKLYFGDWGYLDVHYEAVIAAGETREKIEEMRRRFPSFAREGFLLGEPIDDDRRLLDMTKVVSENDSHITYHRIDRLALTLLPEWGTARVGRQVITWGNGFLFNPMDLFNPFAPTDIERDYKIGDDMVTQPIST